MSGLSLAQRIARVFGLCALITSAAFATSAHAQQRVKFDTTLGSFTVELNAAKAPKTVENFVKYVQDKHYDGTTFHRVIPNFMVQGGGYTKDMKEKTTRAPIQIESNNGLKNDRGTIAMARTNDPNSATSQFFVNVVNNDFLNFKSETLQGYGYAVFGKVVEGMDTIDKIRAVQTGFVGGMQDVPAQPVVINSARLVEAAPAKTAPAKK